MVGSRVAFYDDRRQRGCEGAGGVRLVDEVESSKGVVVAGGKGVGTLTENQKKSVSCRGRDGGAGRVVSGIVVEVDVVEL